MLVKLILFFLSSASLAAPNLADGRLLYEEECEKCHKTPYESLGWNELTKKEEIAIMVGACSDHFQLDWNSQDILDTTEYLNSEFFLFDK